MSLEQELTILEINKEELFAMLKNEGAEFVGSFMQRRYTFDVKPVNPNKWIRLRTNGKKTTLTVKEILQESNVRNSNEYEIITSDFDKTFEVLTQMGFEYRNYQENERTIYNLDGIEISIDSWPQIPTYAELEGGEENITKLIDKLNLNNYKKTTKDVVSIYKDFYNIDILKIKNLTFENKE